MFCVTSDIDELIMGQVLTGAAGQNPARQAAIQAGYSRALTTIIDANVTTVIAALVLYQFGTGPIKGFATVLFWGILISMFTAVYVTRTIFNTITTRKGVTALSI